MMQRQHVVIVGGTRGLGLEVAKRYIDLGMAVSIIARSATQMERLAENHYAHNFDLTTLENLATLSQALQAIGPISYLIFAQRYRGNGDAWQGEIQVTLTATMQLIETLRPLFSTVHDRAITCVSSVYATSVGGTQPISYHVSKAGLNQLVRFYAATLGKDGIRVNAVLPMSYLKDDAPAAKRQLAKEYDKLVPLGRMADVREIANVVEFLSSSKASFVSGQCLIVDGGTSCVWNEELVFPTRTPPTSPKEQ